MKLIKPSYEILSNIDGMQILKSIERIGRTCYKSENKITDDSCVKFVEMIIKNGHESVIEHEKLSVRFINDRGVSHEQVRHRLVSFSQECITGDTIVRKTNDKLITIKDLYDRQTGSNYDKTHNKTLSLRSVNDTGKCIANKFNTIFYKGLNPVYEVTTKLGYKIKCTLNHKFLLPNGNYEILENLFIGDTLMVNGRPALCKLSDDELIKLYTVDGLNATEISEMHSTPYSSVKRKLKELNIFERRKNDKNKEKYNKNRTQEYINKMRDNLRAGYRSGKYVVWNKGITENDHPSVKKQGDALRAHHHNNGYGNENSNWAGGIKEHALARSLKSNILTCELCGNTERLEVHHKDENINNNSIDNLIKVCCKCHNLLHHGWQIGIKIIEDTITSINYVGIEDTYDIEMHAPYHNYIANGFVCHNSTRYVNYAKGETDGDIQFIDISKHLKNPLKSFEIWLKTMRICEDAYLEMIENGESPQIARSVLPNSLKTEICITCNLREWRTIFKQRTAKAAHPQMRELMCPLLDEFKNKIPVIFDDINYD